MFNQYILANDENSCFSNVFYLNIWLLPCCSLSWRGATDWR